MHIFFPKHVISCVNISNVEQITAFDEVCTAHEKVSPLRGHLLWIEPHEKEIEKVLEAASQAKLCAWSSLTIAVTDIKKMTQLLKRCFYIIKAAGGIVENEDKVLLIYRRGLWDLPKGKRKARESSRDAAQREVEEECSVKVRTLEKIGTTYHLLSAKRGLYGLKKTAWYRMQLLDGRYMRPQLDEDIEEVAWFTQTDAQEKLRNSYGSVRYLMRQHLLRLRQMGQNLLD